MKYKSLLISIHLSFLAIAATACGPASFGFKGTSTSNTQVDSPECDCQSPHPSVLPSPSPSPSSPSAPGASPSPKPPCPKPSPQPKACSLHVWVKVASFEVKWEPNSYTTEPTVPGEVDLCELSKDFFGTLEQKLGVRLPEGRRFKQARFILQSVNGHRVEDQFGNSLCSLRLPPSMTAGLRFETDRNGQVVQAQPAVVGYEFHENDALHNIGKGECQLQHPVGHYDLRNLGPS